MKTSLKNSIRSAPLTFPYYDEKELQHIEPMDLRYKVAMFEVTNMIAEHYGISLDRIPEIVLAQYQAGRYVADKMKAYGITKAEASEKSGIDVTSLSKALSGKRPFSPSAAHLVPFCYNVMHESCHKVMFGEEGSILLPSPYTQVVKALLNLDDADRAQLLKKAKLQYALFEQQNPGSIPNAPRRKQSVIISERIHEFIYDKGLQGYQFFGPDTPYQIRGTLKQFLVEDCQKASPRIGFLMYLAFETGTALDYFISEDFTKYTRCFIYDGEGEKEITDTDVLAYLGICSSMPSERRQSLMGEAIGGSMSKLF